MIILLDTDILIDVALARHPFASPAAELLDVLEKRAGSAYIAWHSITNFYYMVKPTRGGSQTKDFIRELLQFVQVASTNSKDVLYALRLPLSDFEDALQIMAAMSDDKMDCIVTRDLKDFKDAEMPVYAPDELLNKL